MTNLDSFTSLRMLADDYENHRISFEEYRIQRHSILTKLDEQHNGIVLGAQDQVHDESSILTKMGGFIKGLKRR